MIFVNLMSKTSLMRASKWFKAFYEIFNRRRDLNISPDAFLELLSLVSLRKKITPDEIASRLEFAEVFQKSLLQYPQVCDLIRLGRNGDGGYFIPRLKYEKLITLGVGKDISFEMDFSQDVKIDLFDHTVERPLDLKKNMRFHKKGIGMSDTFNMLTFNSICKLTGIKSDSVNLLKFDIEGDELLVFQDSDFSDFAAIVCELHWLEDAFYSDRYSKLFTLLANLERGHTLVNVHANNWSKLFNIGRVVLPDVVELTFIKKTLFDPVDIESHIRNEDVPCREGYPEIWPPIFGKF
jgi:hypothetical protein